MTVKPYDTGNDEWIIEQCKLQHTECCGAGFTISEMYRALYLAAEGAHYLSRDEIDVLERRIIKSQEEQRRAAVRAAKTKN